MEAFASFVCMMALCLGSSYATPPADCSEASGSAVMDSAPTESAGADSTATDHGSGCVVVYYFHRTVRCVECLEMEALTVKALARFAHEQERGTLVLRVLNVDEPDTEHFVDDFAVYFNTIILAREEQGTRTAWKDIGVRAWELVPNPDEFIAFLQKEVADCLAAT